MVTSPLPSRLAGRVSRRTTCGCCSCSSAASSMVTMRSPLSIMPDRALSSVVLPEPVPPEMMMLSRQRAAMLQHRRHRRRDVALLRHHGRSRSGACRTCGSRPTAPSMASGGMMMLTRLPSSRRASTSRARSRRRGGRSGVTIRVADVHQVRVVAERDVGQLELAAALDIDLLGAVDHDVGDRSRPRAAARAAPGPHVVDELVDEVALLRPVELDALLDQHLGDQAFELAHQFLARQADRGREVDAAHHQRLHGAARLVDLAARHPAVLLGPILARRRVGFHDIGLIAACLRSGVGTGRTAAG